MRCDSENQIKANRGEDLPWAKLTEDDVRMIRKVHREARAEIDRILSWGSESALAEKFGVHPNTINRVVRYAIWRHVGD